ncbi:MAG: SpoIIE family protein phosphatase [Planctomycetes bacterium]|nr:SpoIIE family protein phosphatase [Planctomycetota bacterium]
MPTPHVQVILADETIPEALETALRTSGVSASFRPLDDAIRDGRVPSADAFVVVAPADSRSIRAGLKVLFSRLADRPRATLVLKSDNGYMPKIAHPPVLPVSFACGLVAEELVVRLSTMLEMSTSLESMSRAAAAGRATDEAFQRRQRDQLRLASRVQRDLLPARTSTFGRVRVSAVFRPADCVSGDIYDVQRLDEKHIGVAIADAAGSDIPTALLTVFIKRALRGKETHADGYRILRPSQVLERLNRLILEADLPTCPLVSVSYAAINIETLEVSLSRGGGPYPIVRRANGTLEPLQPAGSILGVLPDAEFEEQSARLRPGDTLLLHSDGLERVFAPDESAGPTGVGFDRDANAGVPTGGASSATKQGTETLTRSTWTAMLRKEGVEAALEQVASRHEILQRVGHPVDDLTAVAVQVKS